MDLHISKGAAYANHELGVLSVEKRDLIAKVCDEIIEESMTISFLGNMADRIKLPRAI